MKTIFEVTNPDSIEVTMTASMTLHEWKKIRDNMSLVIQKNYNGTTHEFCQRITSIIHDIQKQFDTPKTEE